MLRKKGIEYHTQLQHKNPTEKKILVTMFLDKQSSWNTLRQYKTEKNLCWREHVIFLQCTVQKGGMIFEEEKIGHLASCAKLCKDPKS